MAFWTPQRKELQKLKQLTGVRKRLMKSINILTVMFGEEAFYGTEIMKLTKQSTKASVKALKEDLKEINKTILEILQTR